MTLKSRKGETNVTTETGIVFTIIIFTTSIIWLTQQIHTTFPEVQAMPDFSYLLFAGEMITIAIACNIVTGIACIGAGAFVGLVNFFFIPAYLQLVFLPLMSMFAYVIGRLMRGGG